MNSSLLMGRQGFIHSQESGFPSHAMLTWEDKCHNPQHRLFLFPVGVVASIMSQCLLGHLQHGHWQSRVRHSCPWCVSTPQEQLEHEQCCNLNEFFDLRMSQAGIWSTSFASNLLLHKQLIETNSPTPLSAPTLLSFLCCPQTLQCDPSSDISEIAYSPHFSFCPCFTRLPLWRMGLQENQHN